MFRTISSIRSGVYVSTISAPMDDKYVDVLQPFPHPQPRPAKQEA